MVTSKCQKISSFNYDSIYFLCTLSYHFNLIIIFFYTYGIRIECDVSAHLRFAWLRKFVWNAQAHLQGAAFLNFVYVEHARCMLVAATCARSAVTAAAMAWRRATPSVDSNRFRTLDIFTTHLLMYLVSPVYLSHVERDDSEWKRNL